MNIGEHEEANFCDNLVIILAGNRPILAYIGALACGCNSLKMLVDVAKCELALDGSTGLRTKRSHVRIGPGASSSSDLVEKSCFASLRFSGTNLGQKLRQSGSFRFTSVH